MGKLQSIKRFEYIEDATNETDMNTKLRTAPKKWYVQSVQGATNKKTEKHNNRSAQTTA